MEINNINNDTCLYGSIYFGPIQRVFNDVLIWGSERGDIELVRSALRNGANVRLNNDYALKLASKGGHLAIVKLLIESGCDIKTNGEFSLCLASEYGHLKVVKYFINLGIDVNCYNDYSIRYACENGHLQVVQKLIDCGANIQCQNNYCIKFASKNGQINVVRLLIEKGCDITVENNYALRTTIQNDDLETAKILIKNGADIKIEIDDNLIDACRRDKILTVKFLVENGANVNKSNQLLLTSVQNNNFNIFQYLIESRAKYNSKINEILTYCSEKEYFDFVDYLSHKMDIISWACMNNNLNLIKYLLPRKNKSANYDFEIEMALILGYLDVAKYMISYLSTEINYYYVMRWACNNGHIDVLNYLQTLGLQIDYYNLDIEHVIKRGDLKMLKYLISKKVGANEKLFDALINTLEKNDQNMVFYFGEILQFLVKID
ncbi:ankyrin repeat protein [Moumouvirus australiensis]|uniref:Ankyrin repeat protein n=1 Tax=Moumouvirus australiensis TaxID=2109587 RepID=A0A2P1EMV9_9VIRU|nr:ankyrin repeat protein [Moumouvirus australiensis]AVL95190.1 ankyrin repeat protein [Moumouvirus australiensis]